VLSWWYVVQSAPATGTADVGNGAAVVVDVGDAAGGGGAAGEQATSSPAAMTSAAVAAARCASRICRTPFRQVRYSAPMSTVRLLLTQPR
jgi:hypothetical protein